MKPSWKKIQTEYVTGSLSYRKLADKHKVPLTNLERRAKAEGWVDLRRQYRVKATAKTIEAASDRQADRAARLQDLTDKLMAQVAKVIEAGEASPKGLRELSRTLLDIKELQDIRPDLDIQEQEARIANLRKQANPTGELDSSKYGIVMLPPVQPLTPPDDEGDADG